MSAAGGRSAHDAAHAAERGATRGAPLWLARTGRHGRAGGCRPSGTWPPGRRRILPPSCVGLALASLTKIAAKDEQTVQACAKALADREASVCRQAAKGLAAAGAVPPLIKALRHAGRGEVQNDGRRGGSDRSDVREDTRAAAGGAARQQGRGDPSARGITALGALGKDGAEGVPALGRLLKDAGEKERDRVLAALGKMGPAGKGAGAAVAELLKDQGIGRCASPCVRRWSASRRWR